MVARRHNGDFSLEMATFMSMELAPLGKVLILSWKKYHQQLIEAFKRFRIKTLLIKFFVIRLQFYE